MILHGSSNKLSVNLTLSRLPLFARQLPGA